MAEEIKYGNKNHLMNLDADIEDPDVQVKFKNTNRVGRSQECETNFPEIAELKKKSFREFASLTRVEW
jgi:hypothetical protein